MGYSVAERLAPLAERYNPRPIRERVLMLATALVLVLVAGWELVVVPVQQEHQQLQNRLQSLSANADGLLAQQQTLDRQLATDPSQALRNQLNARQQRLEALNRQISETTGELIAPRAMVALLQKILAAQDALDLQGLELQKPSP
ncbi:MAG: type II secretion system protein GspM, partial [Pseudomonadota bacterium]|nr:type II secretion system protein GspM [Pseudomonadota bacterium]